MQTKKVSSAGRFGARYSKKIREAVITVEKKQRKKQACPYCKRLKAKRISKGLWECKRCDKKFTGGAYYLK